MSRNHVHFSFEQQDEEERRRVEHTEFTDESTASEEFHSALALAMVLAPGVRGCRLEILAQALCLAAEWGWVEKDDCGQKLTEAAGAYVEELEKARKAYRKTQNP